MSLDVTLYLEVDTGGKEPHTIELFGANITHNLGDMAHAGGVYGAVWRPDENGYNNAGDIIPILESGIEQMKADPSKFRSYDAPNGWGAYDNFLPWLEHYLAACKEHPRAKISVWR